MYNLVGHSNEGEQAMRIWIRVAMAVALVLAGLGQQALAHEGHDHKVMGTVTMAASDHLMLKDKDGKTVTVQITKATKIVRGKESLAAADIKAGVRVVITAQQAKSVTNAKTIELGEAPAAK
jgi:hypothetical protein